ncbi:hypothetical protein AB669_18300 [Pedobacter sp. BMA]|nr:hypothetical protein AB669_18300 [Pedobacter sp. BMA]
MLYLTMNLTEKQKESFNKQFLELVSESSEEVQKLWYRIGKIVWPLNIDVPNTFGFETKLVGSIADRYHILINKVHNKTIEED